MSTPVHTLAGTPAPDGADSKLLRRPVYTNIPRKTIFFRPLAALLHLEDTNTYRRTVGMLTLGENGGFKTLPGVKDFNTIETSRLGWAVVWDGSTAQVITVATDSVRVIHTWSRGADGGEIMGASVDQDITSLAVWTPHCVQIWGRGGMHPLIEWPHKLTSTKALSFWLFYDCVVIALDGGGAVAYSLKRARRSLPFNDAVLALVPLRDEAQRSLYLLTGGVIFLLDCFLRVSRKLDVGLHSYALMVPPDSANEVFVVESPGVRMRALSSGGSNYDALSSWEACRLVSPDGLVALTGEGPGEVVGSIWSSSLKQYSSVAGRILKACTV